MFDKFVVRSASASSQCAGNSFWSTSDGWTNLICATVFPIAEMTAFSLAATGEGDAIFIPVAHAYDPSLVSLCDIYDLSPEEYRNGDAIEVQGIREVDGCFEVCNEQPQFFSAYVHLKTGGCQCVGDFGSFKKAKAHADEVAKLNGWPVHSFVPEHFTHA